MADCTIEYKGKNYSEEQVAELNREIWYDYINHRLEIEGQAGIAKEYRDWYNAETRRRVLSTLGDDTKLDDSQVNTIVTLFDTVSRTWGLNNQKNPLDFFEEVFSGIQIVNQDTGEVVQKGTEGAFVLEVAKDASPTSLVKNMSSVFFEVLEGKEKDIVTHSSGYPDQKWEDLSAEDRQDVISKFSEGFISYLNSERTNVSSDTLEKFATFFKGITEDAMLEGIQKNNQLNPISDVMMAVYDSILGITMTENTSDGFKMFSDKPVYQRLEEHGIQVSQRSAEQLKKTAKAYVGVKYGWETAKYLQTTIDQTVLQASALGEIDPNIAYTSAVAYIKDYQNSPLTRTLSPQQQIAMTFAAMEIEKTLDNLGTVLRDTDKVPWKVDGQYGERAELEDIRQLLSAKLDTIASALSISRSVAGFTLGFGSHLIKRARYSPEAVIDSYKKALGKEKLSKKEHDKLTELAKKIVDEGKKLLDTKDGITELEEEQLSIFADSIIESLGRSRDFKRFLEDFSETRKEEVIRNLRENRRKGDFTEESGKDFDKAFKYAIYDLVHNKEVDTSSLLALTEALIESDYGKAMGLDKAKDHPSIQKKIRDTLIVNNELHQEKVKKKVASDLQNVKMELRLIERLGEMLSEKNLEKKASGEVIYNGNVKALQDVLEDLMVATMIDTNISDGVRSQIIFNVEQLLKYYRPQEGGDPGIPLKLKVEGGEIDFASFEPNTIKNMEEVLLAAREIRRLMNIESKQKKIKEFEERMAKFERGEYEGSVWDVLPQYDGAMFLNLATRDKRVRALDEYKDYRRRRTDQEIIEEVFNSITKGSSGLVDYDSMIKQTVEYLKEKGIKTHEGKEITPETVQTALTNVIDRPSFFRGANEKIRSVRQEGRILEKLIEYATDVFGENWTSNMGDSMKQKRAFELNKMIEELEILARLDYNKYTVGIEHSNVLLEKIKKMYQTALTRDSGEDIGSLDEIVQMMRAYQDARDLASYQKRTEIWEKELQRFKAMKDSSEVRISDIGLIRGMFPKYIDKEIEAFRREAKRKENEAKTELKKKILKDYIDKIKKSRSGEGEFDLAQIEGILRVDSEIERRDRAVQRRNREVQRLIKNLADYVAMQRALENRGDYRKAMSAALGDFMRAPRVTVLAGDASYITYQGGFALPFMLKYPKVGAKMLSTFVTTHAKEFQSSWFAKKLADGYKMIGGDGDWIYKEGAASKNFRDNQSALQNSLTGHGFWEDGLDHGLRLMDTSNMEIEEELQMASLTEYLGVGGMMRYAVPGVEQLSRMTERNAPAIARSVGTLNEMTKDYLKKLRGFGERTYINYMNTLRLEMYKHGVLELAIHNKPGEDYEEAKMRWADYVNTMTGGGTRFTGIQSADAKIEKFIEATTGPLIAPRLYASSLHSVIETTLLPDAYRAIRRRNGSEVISDPMREVEKLILQRNMMNLAAMSSWHVMAYLMKYASTMAYIQMYVEDEKKKKASEGALMEIWDTYINPFSSKFGKIDVGNRTIALTPMSGYMRTLAMLFLTPIRSDERTLGFQSNIKQDQANWKDIGGNFFRYRFNPAIEAILSQGIYNQDFMGNPAADTIGGKFLEVAKGSSLMIWMQGAVDNIAAGDYTSLMGQGFLDIMGINNYENNPFYSPKVQNYLEKPAGSTKGMSPNFGMHKDQPVKGSKYEMLIKQRMSTKFGYWLNRELMNGNRPRRGTMNRKWKEFRDEAFKYYGYEYERPRRR